MNENNPADLNDVSRIYRSLRLIRRAEEEIARVYPTDKIKSPVHLSIGQESIAVGVCDVLEPDDVVSGTYRGHAAYLAKGGDLKALMAELYGKSTGCAGGKAGSMHLIDMNHNILGCSAVVGTTIPVAMGYALALKREGKGRIAVSFLGDGATEEGVFTESLNFAALHKLPILFVCENNGYAIHSPQSNRWATDRLCERVETFDIPAKLIPDGDVYKIREAVSEAVSAIRAGKGPYFLECRTYRWCEHVGPGEDYEEGYRDREELAPWIEKDQVMLVAKQLDEMTRERIEREVEEEVSAAIAFAEESPFPEIGELYTDVYAE